MAIENKGPGGVGNSYGQRSTNQPTKIGAGMPNDVYNEFGTGAGVVAVTDPITGEVTGLIGPDGQEISLGGGGRSTGKSLFQLRVATSSRATANSTVTQLCTVPDGFEAFRLVLRNYDTAAPMVFTAKAAASPTITTNGVDLTPVSVTFGRNVSGVLQTSVSVPAAVTEASGGQVSPSIVVSDWISLSSVPRTDVVGADPAFYLRVTSPQGIYYDPINWSTPNALATGITYLSSFAFGSDLVSSWTSATLAAPASAFLTDVAIEFMSGGRKASIMVFADSLAAGSASPTTNYVIQALPLLKAAGINCAIGTYASGGQKRQTSSENLRKHVTAVRPDVVVLHDYSVNSNTAPAIAVGEQIDYLLGDVDHIIKNGGLPIVVTMHSNDSYAARVRKMLANRCPVVDMAALLSNGAGGIKDEYCANIITDRTHISQEGAAVIASDLARVLASAIA